MKKMGILTIGLVVLFLFNATFLFAQTKTLDGVNYTVITPANYAFDADSGKLKVGQKYVIDGSVLSVSGTTLMLSDTGIHLFNLSNPISADLGAKVTVYVEIQKVSSFSVSARVIKIEGAGIKQVQSSSGTRTLDGVQYQIITPKEYAFNADSGKIKAGQKYVIDGSVLSISGATLMLSDTGIHLFTLTSPFSAGLGTNVTIYIEVEKATSFSVSAKVIKINTR